MGAKAQHEKHGCLIPTPSRKLGGKNSMRVKQTGAIIRNRGKQAEKEFDAWAKKMGYNIFNNGFPDRVIEINGKIVFVEIKTRKSKLTKAQKTMRKLLESYGFEYIVWKPDYTR